MTLGQYQGLPLRKGGTKMNKKGIALYVMGTYLLFFVCLLGVGLIMLVTKQNNVSQLGVAFCSWTPTMMLLLLFPKLKLGETRRGFIKGLFKGPIKWREFLLAIGVQVLIFMVATIYLMWQRGVALQEVLNLSLGAIGYAMINNLITGATGEEAGWRGFLQPIMEKRYGVIHGSIVVGVIWGFWHTPLWFLTSGYTGRALLTYIVLFMLYIISTAVIMGIIYHSSRNIIVPMLMHFTVNFTVAFFRGDVLGWLGVYTILYVIAAVGFSHYFFVRSK